MSPVRLVQRRHVDLLRVAAAACPGSPLRAR
ncbi:putative leader peptide [Pseudonocardia endophytica]